MDTADHAGGWSVNASVTVLPLKLHIKKLPIRHVQSI